MSVSRSVKIDFKPSFLFFQIVGWIGFSITDALIGQSSYLTNARNFLIWLSSMAIGVLISLGLRYYYKYFLKKRSGILSIALLIVTGTLMAALLWLYLGDYFRYLVFSVDLPRPDLFGFIKRLYFTLWVYLVWSILYFGLKFWIHLMEEKIRAGKADADTRQAQLRMLRYQINPHFLFNTLNSIKALLSREPLVAENMITEFSEFLRYSLRHNDKTFISLEEEIEIVKKYLLLEKTRFEERLDYKFDNSPESLKVPVLCFLLQPFVENAIKHGLKNTPSGIRLSIRSFIRSDKLHIEIENTGSWTPESDKSGTGIRNVTDRLETAYPGKHTFNIEKGTERVLVTITITLEE